MLKPITVSAVLAGVLLLAACDNSPKAPTDAGVCYQVATKKDGEIRFNKLAENQPSIEACIARLEELRVRFLGMGGSRREITGSYQGKFIFIDGSGVALADSMKSGRFYAFTRGPGGVLALPNVVNRPPAQPESAPAEHK